jgi:hypothetical protein
MRSQRIDAPRRTDEPSQYTPAGFVSAITWGPPQLLPARESPRGLRSRDVQPSSVRDRG